MRMRMMRLELRRDMEAILGLMAQKEGLVQFVAHDLKNLLGTLVTNLELLQGHPERAARYRERIEAGTRTMLGMVQNMLDLSLQEAGGLVLRPAPLRVGDWLGWIRPDLEAPTLRGGQHLALDAAPGLELRADPQLLQRALVNLLENACKYGPEESEVRLTAAACGSGVRFQVADLGPGIPREMKRRVFDRYARLDPEGAAYAGHGLGLAFCHLVATLHGGAIWIEDNQPRGSRFILELPAGQD
jgi:signal transduction histidine kinase